MSVVLWALVDDLLPSIGELVFGVVLISGTFSPGVVRFSLLVSVFGASLEMMLVVESKAIKDVLMMICK
jgi:hypothetical protein